jgi:hypothetical protein
MATDTNPKNGNVTSETSIDFTHEAKIAVGALLDAANLVSENGKSLLNAQAQLLNTGLKLYQHYSQVYTDLFLAAVQQYLDQSIMFTGEMSRILATNYSKLVDLTTSDQKLVLEATEAYQAQAIAATEQLVDLFKLMGK